MNAAFRPSDETYRRIEERLGHTFAERALLERALTHGSAKSPATASNERLEFVGDAVIGLVIGEFLFREFGDLQEGRLTRIRAKIVSAKNLTAFARSIQLENFMIVGKMYHRPETITDSIVSDAVEALFGAVFLDAGYDAARACVLRHFEPTVRELASTTDQLDAKSTLHEWAQSAHAARPAYRLENRTGPAHALIFEVSVTVADKEVGRGIGPSMRAAEEAAAKKALSELGVA